MVKTMTSRKSNCLNLVEKTLQSRIQEYPGLDVSVAEVNQHVSALFEGFGIRLLNTIDTNSLGAFLFFNNDFYLLKDANGFAQGMKIDDNLAGELLSLFYLSRTLASIPRLYSDDIILINKQLNDKIFSLFG